MTRNETAQEPPMFATIAILAALAANEPSFPTLVVTVHGPSQTQAQLARNEVVAHARADLARELRAAADATQLRGEVIAAVRAHAAPESLTGGAAVAANETGSTAGSR